MFKELHNEAVYRFQITTESPFVIKSGEEAILDPTAPKSQVLRAYHNGEPQVVIPGSSLKGVFRSRSEQLLHTMGCKMNSNNIKADKKDTGKIVYEKSDPAQKLFGSTGMKGRIYFQDAFPVSGTDVIVGRRHMVGINRITGGADTGKKFESEVVEQGIFQVEIKLVNYELKQLALIAWLLLDLHEGFMKLGSYTTRGFGRFSVGEVNLEIREYRPHVDKLASYSEADDVIDVKPHWNKSLLKKIATFSTLDQLIGSEGIFQSFELSFDERRSCV